MCKNFWEWDFNEYLRKYKITDFYFKLQDQSTEGIQNQKRFVVAMHNTQPKLDLLLGKRSGWRRFHYCSGDVERDL